MKPLIGMGRTLAFGIVAALAVIPWQLALGGLSGAGDTFAAYALLCACAFPLAVAPSLRAIFLGGVFSVVLCGAVFALAPEPTTAVLGAALAAALVRALYYRAQLARAVALELILLVLSLGAARLFGGPSPFGLALGLWAYALVQSAYFLLLRPEQRERAASPTDAFDAAHARAMSLLERP